MADFFWFFKIHIISWEAISISHHIALFIIQKRLVISTVYISTGEFFSFLLYMTTCTCICCWFQIGNECPFISLSCLTHSFKLHSFFYSPHSADVTTLPLHRLEDMAKRASTRPCRHGNQGLWEQQQQRWHDQRGILQELQTPRRPLPEESKQQLFPFSQESE